MNERAAVMGTVAGIKTLADDTVRIQVDVSPTVGSEALELFWRRGTDVALARVKPEIDK